MEAKNATEPTVTESKQVSTEKTPIATSLVPTDDTKKPKKVMYIGADNEGNKAILEDLGFEVKCRFEANSLTKKDLKENKYDIVIAEFTGISEIEEMRALLGPSQKLMGIVKKYHGQLERPPTTPGHDQIIREARDRLHVYMEYAPLDSEIMQQFEEFAQQFEEFA